MTSIPYRTIALALILLCPAANTVCAALDNIADKLESEKRLFTIEMREADIRDVLRALAQQGGLNIILGKGVEGKVTLSFKNIRFKDALEITLRAHDLGYTIRNDVLWVGKKADMTSLGDLLDETKREVIRLKYADPAKVIIQVQGMLSHGGTAVPDARTNSVIIGDFEKNIASIKKLLEVLDVQEPQVLIEAEVVEAKDTFAKELGVQWGGRYTSAGDVIGGSSALPNAFTDRNFAVSLPATSPTAGLGILVGSISSKLILDIQLSAAERKGDLKIISRPKIATLNNKTATIHSGLTFRVKISQSVLAGETVTTTATTGTEEIKTGIDLTVTPQITDDDFILLNISIHKSDPDFTQTVDGIPSVIEKSASTHVLIKNGETVVIGGLYKNIASKTDDTVPLLGKIPLLGWLFKNHLESTQKEELLVFLTPTIIRPASVSAEN